MMRQYMAQAVIIQQKLIQFMIDAPWANVFASVIHRYGLRRVRISNHCSIATTNFLGLKLPALYDPELW